MTVTIPDDRMGDIQVDEHDALVDIAIGIYKREQVSLGRAAEIANMSPPAFLHELERRKIPINYGVDDLRQDLCAPDRLESLDTYLKDGRSYTTPITTLLKADQADLLHSIFGSVTVPGAVFEELRAFHAEIPELRTCPNLGRSRPTATRNREPG